MTDYTKTTLGQMLSHKDSQIVRLAKGILGKMQNKPKCMWNKCTNTVDEIGDECRQCYEKDQSPMAK